MKVALPVKQLIQALIIASIAASNPALAQTYPERSMTLIVPFPAGGGTDQTARLFAHALERHAKQAVTVINRPGAGGEIGMSALARALANGYTLGLINTPNVLSIPIERPAQFKTGSFDYIANLADDPATLSAHAQSGIESISQLVAAARKAPDTLTYGTAGIGSAGHISMLMLEKETGIKLVHVPYKGTSEVRTALLGEQIDIAAVNLSEALNFSSGTPWKILGVMSSERSEYAPSLSTFKEQGYALRSGSLRGIGAPAGLPQPIRERLQALIKEVIADPLYIKETALAKQENRMLYGNEYAFRLQTEKSALSELWRVSPWKQ